MKGHTTAGMFFRVSFFVSRKALEHLWCKRDLIGKQKLIRINEQDQHEKKRRHSMIRVNGEVTNLHPGMTLTSYLQEKKYQIQRVAVEINGDIVPKREYDTTVIRDGDEVEVVSFVGGG